MFSGLTNQMSSLLSTVKGGSTDQEGVAAAAGEAAASGDAPVAEPQQLLDQESASGLPTAGEGGATETGENAAGEEKQSPTKVGGLFSGVKSQMSGWLPTVSMPTMSMPTMPAMPNIPGLRKHQEDGTIPEEDALAAGAAAEAAIAEEATGGDDEDKSRYQAASATEGADSKPNTQPGTPTEEQPGQIGAVTTKMTQGVKSFGSFLYSSAHKAGEKIKKTVDSHEGILGQFNKDQDAFIKSQQGAAAGVAPWIGKPSEDQVKEEILTLSTDRRNFVRAPPAAVDFQFDYDVSYPIAQAIMVDDPSLEKMRFELVPKIITEEHFWRNYFYRVSLICQAAELGTLGNDGSLAASEENEGN